ncbi:HK97 family phage prohead protease [Paracoccus hibiscisoli]|uniref:HK97 family phage prohead protease n=1 Tax=Paracoccus hibiscisoli TaxID=2023261 RepID=UPI0023F4447A|nr:HK97 family phage prohead protease [Paracoccus hibiscisoli]
MTVLDVKYAGVTPDVLEENGTIKGYASLFGMKDQGGDVVMPGAFAASLATGRHIAMLWQHDPAQPIGKWTVVREDEKGLYIEGKLSLKTQRGLEAYEMLKDGIIRGLSIGYRVEKSKRTAAGRELWKMALWEVSLVTFPMQAEAGVGDVKGEDSNFAIFKRNVEKFARDAGFSAVEAKAAAAGAVTGLSGARDAADKPSAYDIAEMIRQIATN